MAEQLLVVAQFIAACKKPPVYCIITEYMSQGTLRMYLNKKDPYSLSAETILKLALDISRGMEYLHAQGVIHRDLKSQNLLLNDEMRVKVADFGTSCLETKCQATKGNKGTYRWMAPEMTKEKPYTRKVDVYSFGIVLWELTTCLLPFQGMTPVQAAYAASEKVLILFQCPCLERIPLFLTELSITRLDFIHLKKLSLFLKLNFCPEPAPAAVDHVPAGAQQPDQEVLVGEPGAAAGVQLHRVGAGEVRPLRQGGDAGDGAPGAQALAIFRQGLQDGMHRQQLVHTGARVIHLPKLLLIVSACMLENCLVLSGE
jgi:hypothetical protein